MDLQKRLLDEIVGFGGIARVAAQPAAQHWRDERVELLERGEVAGLVGGHQGAQPDLVRHPVGHVV